MSLIDEWNEGRPISRATSNYEMNTKSNRNRTNPFSHSYKGESGSKNERETFRELPENQAQQYEQGNSHKQQNQSFLRGSITGKGDESNFTSSHNFQRGPRSESGTTFGKTRMRSPYNNPHQHGSMIGFSKHPSSNNSENECEQPIFSLRQLDPRTIFQYIHGNWRDFRVKYLSIGNGSVIIATTDCKLLRWQYDPSVYDRSTRSSQSNVQSPGPNLVTIPYTQGSDGIYRLYTDPTGFHTVIAMQSGTNFYLNVESSEPQPLKKMSGIIIESVAWNRKECTPESTSEILIGTRRGQIFRTLLKVGLKTINTKLMLEIGECLPVCGLQMECFPDCGSSVNKIFVMAVTTKPTRYYEFVGGSDLDSLFHIYRTASMNSNNSGSQSIIGGGNRNRGLLSSGFDNLSQSCHYMELPSNLAKTELYFYSRLQRVHKLATAKSFAVLTDVGVYHGELQFSSQNPGDKVVVDEQLLPFQSESESFGMTEFHFVLINSENNSLVVKNRLDMRTAFTHAFAVEKDGKLLGVAQDPLQNIVWVYTNLYIFQMIVIHESRYVWQMYLDKAVAGEARHFGTATEYCQTSKQRDIVTIAQADFYFRRGSYKLAAKYYALSKMSFEQAALKLIHSGQIGALTLFLHEILAQCDTVSNNSSRSNVVNEMSSKLADGSNDILPATNLLAQQTMLCTWLTELYLADIDAAEDSDDAGNMEQAIIALKHFLQERTRLNQLDRITILSLLEAHGRMSLILFYAQITADFERLLSHYIQLGDYKRSLSLLCDLNKFTSQTLAGFVGSMNDSSEDSLGVTNQKGTIKSVSRTELQKFFCKYSPILIEQEPAMTIDSWISAPWLEPTLLIPSLVKYRETRQHSIITAKQKTLSMMNLDSGCVNQTNLNDPYIRGVENDNCVSPYTSGLDDDQALRYLRHCVDVLGNRDVSIHNYLLSIYASIPPFGSSTYGTKNTIVDVDDLESLEDTLSQQSTHKHPLIDFIEESISYHDGPAFNIHYALRTCGASQPRQTEACVLLFQLLGRHEEAVISALSVKPKLVKLAMDSANSPPDISIRRKLWLQIAQSVVSDKGDMIGAFNLLTICNSSYSDDEPILRIEDILPFFPPFDAIDSFKLPVCQSLRNYNNHAKHLDSEMREFTDVAERIRNDLKILRNRYGYVDSSKTCDLCMKPVTIRGFFLFPCSHVFHCDCLEEEMKLHMSAQQRQRLSHLQSELRTIEAKTSTEKDNTMKAKYMQKKWDVRKQSYNNGTTNCITTQNNLTALANTRNEIEELVASECPFCSEVMIQSISTSFFESKDVKIADTWDVKTS